MKTWNEKGVEGFTSLFTSFWDTVVVGSLQAMGERDFWMDSFLGYVLICLFWSMGLVILGAFTAGFASAVKNGWQEVVPGFAGFATGITFTGLALVLGGVIYYLAWPAPEPVVEDLDIPLRLELLDEIQAHPFYAEPAAAKARLEELQEKVEFLQPDRLKREELARRIGRAHDYAVAVIKRPRDDWREKLSNRMGKVREFCALDTEDKEPQGRRFPVMLAVMLFITTFVTVGGTLPR